MGALCLNKAQNPEGIDSIVKSDGQKVIRSSFNTKAEIDDHS